LDWEAEGAVAMVVMPKKTDPAIVSFVHAIDDDWYGNVNCSGRMYEAIATTLQANLAERIITGEITEGQLVAIADFLFDVFDGNSICRDPQVKLVAKGGGERLMNVWFDYTDVLLPRPGAKAQAGPDGDVLVLGEFWFHEVTGAEEMSSYGTMRAGEKAVTIGVGAGVTHKAQVAIGWFTK